MKIGDPSDKLDAAADGNFGGKHTTNRRAGYSKTVTINGEEITELEWLIRRAKKDHTLASGEGRKIVEHYEAELDALWRTLSDQIVIGNQMQDSLIRQDRVLAALREPSDMVVDALREYVLDLSRFDDALKAIQVAVAAAEKDVVGGMEARLVLAHEKHTGDAVSSSSGLDMPAVTSTAASRESVEGASTTNMTDIRFDISAMIRRWVDPTVAAAEKEAEP